MLGNFVRSFFFFSLCFSLSLLTSLCWASIRLYERHDFYFRKFVSFFANYGARNAGSAGVQRDRSPGKKTSKNDIPDPPSACAYSIPLRNSHRQYRYENPILWFSFHPKFAHNLAFTPFHVSFIINALNGLQLRSKMFDQFQLKRFPCDIGIFAKSTCFTI